MSNNLFICSLILLALPIVGVIAACVIELIEGREND